MNLREQIKRDLVLAISKLAINDEPASSSKRGERLAINESEIEVTRTSDAKFGDYSTNIALRVAGAHPRGVQGSSAVHPGGESGKQSPLEFAKFLTDKMRDLPYVEKVEVAGPGFINFFIKPEVWQKVLLEQLSNRGTTLNLNAEKRKIIVEYAHPNTHKLFHIGHLRNICTGESIARILEAVGNKVIRANYQGDVGLHIAKALWGIKNLGEKIPPNLDGKIELLSRAYAVGNKAYEENQKEEIEQINKKIYGKDPEFTKLLTETRLWSLEYFDRIYKRLGTKFDRLYFESEVADLGKEQVLAFLKRGVFEESEGAVIFPGDKYGLHKRVFINSMGFPTYEAKDVGLAKLQMEENNPDLIAHVVAPEQTDYFKVLFCALEQIYPEIKGKELHLVYGWVRLKEGKMSSRKGEVITGEWLLDEVKKKALEIIDTSAVKKDVNREQVAEAVAVGAVKYAFLKLGLSQDLVFDLKEAVNLNGNSGPYLQYTYARCKSVLFKLPSESHNRVESNSTRQAGLSIVKDRFSGMTSEEDLLLRQLGHFEEVVLDAAAAYSPNIIANFLYEIAQKYNSFYNNLPILKAEEKERERRLFLTGATADILKKGLYILGISAPEKM